MVSLEKLPKPFKDKILIEVLDLEEKTKSGLIYIPQVAKDKHRSIKGKVIEVGEQCELGIQPGTVAYFEEFAGSRMFIETPDGLTKDYLYIPEKAIMMIVEED